jgi:hypothetical protein
MITNISFKANHLYLIDIHNNEVHRDCCSDYDLSLDERQLALAKAIYWVRNRKLGLNMSMILEIYLGAKGHMTHITTTRKVWVPSFEEHCGYSKDEIDDKYHPYARYKHCNTADHIKYLVKYKAADVISRGNSRSIAALMSIVSIPQEDVPLYINEFDDKIKENEYFKILLQDRMNNVCQLEG